MWQMRIGGAKVGHVIRRWYIEPNIKPKQIQKTNYYISIYIREKKVQWGWYTSIISPWLSLINWLEGELQRIEKKDTGDWERPKERTQGHSKLSHDFLSFCYFRRPACIPLMACSACHFSYEKKNKKKNYSE